MSVGELMVGAGVGLAVWFVAAWEWSRRRNNLGWVDVAWAGAFAPMVLVVAAVAGQRLAEGQAVVWSMAGMYALWSVRLAWHVGRRVLREEPKEDERYAVLRECFGGGLWPKALLVFLAQGVLVWVLLAPLWVLLAGAKTGWGVWQTLGVVVWAAGLIGEGVADAQLARFKKRERAGELPPGGVCEEGLWGYSRHPNYFFEWVVWVGLALFASGGGYWWAAWAAPAVMLFLLLKVTGVPPAEARSLASRGEAYRQYRARVSVFFPLPRLQARASVAGDGTTKEGL